MGALHNSLSSQPEFIIETIPGLLNEFPEEQQRQN
jgi:hypothetical protein